MASEAGQIILGLNVVWKRVDVLEILEQIMPSIKLVKNVEKALRFTHAVCI